MVAECQVPGAALTREHLPPGFVRWRLSLAPGAERASSASEWEGAIVLVARGTLDIECLAGGCERFHRGDLLALGWLPVRALRNPGRAPLELVAVRRVGSSG